MRAVANIFLIQRQRSPSAHFVRRSGGTPCWGLLFIAFVKSSRLSHAVSPLRNATKYGVFDFTWPAGRYAITVRSGSAVLAPPT